MIIGIGAMAASVAASYATRSSILGNTVGDLASGVTKEVGSGVLLYPQSRENELEADRIGLFLLADAGYDPRAAIDFWARAVDDPDFSASLPFFSSHPPARERLAQLQQLLPSAEQRFARRGNPGTPAQAWSAGVPSVHPPVGSTRGLPPPPDTFAVTLPAPSGSGLAPTLAATLSQEFRVEHEGAVLYERPSTSSRAVGEFRRGAVLQGRPYGKGWVRVEIPDRGYLSERSVAQTSLP